VASAPFARIYRLTPWDASRHPNFSLSPPQELDITALLAIPLFLATYICDTVATFYRTPIAQPPTDRHRFKARHRPLVVSVSIDRLLTSTRRNSSTNS